MLKRQALRAISSRTEISATFFQVYYTYSDLKAEPSELMLKYFDIGFYYADWGSKDTLLRTLFEQGQLTHTKP